MPRRNLHENTTQNFKGNAKGNAEMNAKGNAMGNVEGNAKGNAEGNAKGNAEGNAEGNVEGNAKGNAEGNTEGNVKRNAEGNTPRNIVENALQNTTLDTEMIISMERNTDLLYLWRVLHYILFLIGCVFSILLIIFFLNCRIFENHGLRDNLMSRINALEGNFSKI